MAGDVKRAWLEVISCVVCIFLFGVFAPFVGTEIAMTSFAILAVNGLGTFLGRAEKADERELSIGRRAVAVAFGVSYLAFVLILMGQWAATFLIHKKAEVSIHVLPQTVLAGWLLGLLAHGVVVLVSHKRHIEANDA